LVNGHATAMLAMISPAAMAARIGCELQEDGAFDPPRLQNHTCHFRWALVGGSAYAERCRCVDSTHVIFHVIPNR
jgi:hypothetical protein